MRTLAFLFALAIAVVPAHAQSLTVGGAVQQNRQRFDGDPSLNRLDGDSIGWMIGVDARVNHWMIRGEGSRDANVRNVQHTTLLVRGQPATITSELAHDMREVAVLGGYVYEFSDRFELALLGGISKVTVHRAFTTDAGTVVLVPPSNVPPVAVTTTFVDRFAVWTAEGNVGVHLTRHIRASAGVRFQPISLTDDLSGRSLRLFLGAAWRLK
jgi:hypothetical protein